MAAFDAVFGRSLTARGLGVTCNKAHGRPGLLPPAPRVGRAWCLGPSFQTKSVRAVAAAGSLTRHHPLSWWSEGAKNGSPVSKPCFSGFP